MTATPPCRIVTVAELARQIRLLAACRARTIIGIAGTPGAGKSTIADRLVRVLGGAAVLIPMDGFHLANGILDALGRRGRKGAPDTFDADGYVALLERVRHQREDVVYAPTFCRDLEEPIAANIAIDRQTPIVVTEGNYLLLESPPWNRVRDLLDVTWFLDVDEETRIQRLVARHRAFGKSLRTAWLWTHGSDERNAALIRATSHRADGILCLGSRGAGRRTRGGVDHGLPAHGDGGGVRPQLGQHPRAADTGDMGRLRRW